MKKVQSTEHTNKKPIISKDQTQEYLGLHLVDIMNEFQPYSDDFDEDIRSYRHQIARNGKIIVEPEFMAS